MHSDNTTEEIKTSLRKQGYSEVVIDHWINPRNMGQMKSFDGFSGKITSSCGDSIWIWIKVRNNHVFRINFISDICIGAVSAGSMITEMVEDKSIKEALRITPEVVLSALGGLPDKYVHCTQLAVKALKYAIADYNEYEAAPWKRVYKPRQP